MKKGFFVTFEGTEGSGKSTLIQTLFRSLSAQRIDTVITREPGGTSAAEDLRKKILEHAWTPLAELFLYEACRAEHVQNKILPALKAGQVVLCDRFTDSTLAYQGAARKLDWREIKKLNAVATNNLKPDLTVFLDIDPEFGLRRATDPNRFELEGVLFQKKVQKGLRRCVKEDPKRFLVIRIRNQTPEALAEIVMNEIQRRIHRKRTNKR